jgi:multiple sugar transport system permease protein/raffinose/stachyose/melibiose transport system permease protein
LAASRAITGYLFVLPTLILMGVFTFYPFVQGIALSFQSWDGVGRDTPWVGLANYEKCSATRSSGSR